MNKDINFMSFENLNKLLEEYKKINYPYKSYEFDSISYNLLLSDIHNLIEKNEQKDNAIDECIEFVKSLSSKGRDCMIYADIKKDILEKLQQAKGNSNND